MNMEKIRVRFAPSPTGYLHVGGVRTALFNWLFAKNKGGAFILRIEDTDKTRSTKEAVTQILESLRWLGLDWDEGPFFQSERINLYKKYCEKLAGENRAYAKDGAVFFRTPKNKTAIEDIVHGRIEFDTGLLDDFVIMKSDGMPAYNFACVIDDALMGITHVIRGDDHISNTPRQVMLADAMGFGLPHFAHVPMILGTDGARLSKRHGAESTDEYKKQGYLPEAFLNFLVLLGWAPGENKEIMPKHEIIERFTLKRITGKSAVFDTKKLTWMNAVYISGLSDKDLTQRCRPFLYEKGFSCPEERLLKIVPLFKKRIKTLSDITNATEYFFKEQIKYDETAKEKLNNAPRGVLEKVKDALRKTEPFSEEKIENTLKGLLDTLGLKPRDLMQICRAAVTGRTVSAGIFETISAMGKELALRHIEQAINSI